MYEIKDINGEPFLIVHSEHGYVRASYRLKIDQCFRFFQMCEDFLKANTLHVNIKGVRYVPSKDV